MLLIGSTDTSTCFTGCMNSCMQRIIFGACGHFLTNQKFLVLVGFHCIIVKFFPTRVNKYLEFVVFCILLF